MEHQDWKPVVLKKNNNTTYQNKTPNNSKTYLEQDEIVVKKNISLDNCLKIKMVENKKFNTKELAKK